MNIFKNLFKTAALALLIMGNTLAFGTHECFNHQKAFEAAARIALHSKQLLLQQGTLINNFLANATAEEVQQLLTNYVQHVQHILSNNQNLFALETLQELGQLLSSFLNIGNIVELQETALQNTREVKRLFSLIDMTKVQQNTEIESLITQIHAIEQNIISLQQNMPHKDLVEEMMAPIKQQIASLELEVINQMAPQTTE